MNFGLGQSTRSESIKIMNNENKQNQTGKIDPSLGRRVIDELLALKEEMAERIENTITLVEQNFDHRLENAILFLAGYGDSENLEDSIGFNESDSRFAHSLLMELQSGAMLTVKQAETALQMMQKYSQTQLEPNGYSLPRTWEEISHQYRERTIKSDAFQTLMVLQRDEDRGMYITILYNSDHYYIDIETYIGDDDHALQTTEETLEAAGELIGNGFDLYVDPDIEAAYYLWQQEQKAETGSGQISALLNNENKQNQTHKIDSFLGWKNIDELLAFKEEMAGRIEETIALVEQNYFDRRLENAILFLAGCGDGENQEDSVGFNGSDSRFGYYLAKWLQKGENLTLKQAETALQMMQKYSQTQLEPNGYSLPRTWEEISHQYRERTIESDAYLTRIVLQKDETYGYYPIKTDTYPTGMVLKRDEEHGVYIAVFYTGNTELRSDLLECADEDYSWYDQSTYDQCYVLRVTEALMTMAAEWIHRGYPWYVDPDIEAAYYLWQEEQKAQIGSGRISASFSGSATASESVANDTVNPTGDTLLEMVYVPQGEFLMGSPETELERREDEGPQHRSRFPPFTWVSTPSPNDNGGW